jgi:hypothetical protein
MGRQRQSLPLNVAYSYDTNYPKGQVWINYGNVFGGIRALEVKRVRRSSEILFLAEMNSRPVDGENPGKAFDNYTLRDAFQLGVFGLDLNSGSFIKRSRYIHSRSSQSYLFFDGHVELLSEPPHPLGDFGTVSTALQNYQRKPYKWRGATYEDFVKRFRP